MKEGTQTNDGTCEENTTSFENTTEQLSKKKKQYIEQAIEDKQGTFSYEQNPSLYKKARKRLQNRESAVRSRQKKKQEVEVLEEQLRKMAESKAAVESANEELKRQNKYWEELFSKQQLQSQQASGTHLSAEPTRSNVSNRGTESNLDLSYESLDL